MRWLCLTALIAACGPASSTVPTPSPIGSEPAPHPPPPEPAADRETVLRGRLSALWRANRQPVAMERAVVEAGFAVRSEPAVHRSVAADVDGDGELDWVGVVGVCTDEPCVDGGDQWIPRLVVVLGSGATQVLARHARWNPDSVTLTGVADVTGDGRSDVVGAVTECGAHTCETAVSVWTDAGRSTEPIAVSSPHGQVSESGAVLALEEATGDGLPDVVVTGGLVASAGAGPWQRQRRSVWSVRDGSIVLISRSYEPSQRRLHRLHDALLALDADDASCVGLLTEVIESDSLDDAEFSGAEPDDELRGQLARAAALLLVRWHARQSQAAPARRWARWLSRRDRAGRFDNFARQLVAATAANLDEACGQAGSAFDLSIEGDESYLLSSTSLGYNSPVMVTAERICAP